MERITELLGRISELTTEELTELSTLITSQFDEVEKGAHDATAVATLDSLMQATDAVIAERAAREQADAEAKQKIADARTKIDGLNGKVADPDADPDADDGADPDADDDDPEAKAKIEAKEPVGAGVTAGGATVHAMAAGSKPSGSPDAADLGGTPVALVASSDFRSRSVHAGDEIPDIWTLAEGMAESLRRGTREGGVVIASASWEYPEERRLGSDAMANEKKLRAVVSPQAITAAGGTCAPVTIDFSIPMFPTDDRVLNQLLPAYQADRGGLTFVPPTAPSTFADATTQWTAATDADPGDVTKGIYTLACGEPTTVYVYAAPTRLLIGNFMGRYAPEQLANQTETAFAQAARNQELYLLAAMDAASTTVTSAKLLGASRDVLTTLDLMVAAYRDKYRIGKSTMFTAVFPHWAVQLFRSDLTRELAHDGELTTTMALSEDDVIALLRERGVNAGFMLDCRAAQTLNGVAIYDQSFAFNATGGQVPDWPGRDAGTTLPQMVWNLFPEGTFQFLDGGRLDLGIVRDSILDAQNNYEIFVEPFEAVAMRGLEAFTIVSSVVPNGESAATFATTSYYGTNG